MSPIRKLYPNATVVVQGIASIFNCEPEFIVADGSRGRSNEDDCEYHDLVVCPRCAAKILKCVN